MMVKADAYGHGLTAVAHAVSDVVDGYGVAAVGEGAALRLSGIKKPVLVAAYTPAEVDGLFAFNLTAAVKDVGDVAMLNRTAARLGKTLDVQIKCDTGMRRFGSDYDGVKRIMTALDGRRHLRLTGVFTHLYSSNDADVDAQLSKAERSFALTGRVGHVFASDNLFLRGGNSARIGLAAYGYLNFENDLGLQPALSCYSTVLCVRELATGDGLGYNHTYVAERPTTVAVVGAGYGDGVLRRQKTALIRGVRAPIIGGICMDALMLDVTGLNARAGDRVTLLGADGRARLTARDVAEECGTIPYEILTAYHGRRLQRIYLN